MYTYGRVIKCKGIVQQCQLNPYLYTVVFVSKTLIPGLFENITFFIEMQFVMLLLFTIFHSILHCESDLYFYVTGDNRTFFYPRLVDQHRAPHKKTVIA